MCVKCLCCSKQFTNLPQVKIKPHNYHRSTSQYTYSIKYGWPVGEVRISHPGGSWFSSNAAPSYDCVLVCVGGCSEYMPAELVGIDKDAGELCALEWDIFNPVLSPGLSLFESSLGGLKNEGGSLRSFIGSELDEGSLAIVLLADWTTLNNASRSVSESVRTFTLQVWLVFLSIVVFLRNLSSSTLPVLSNYWYELERLISTHFILLALRL